MDNMTRTESIYYYYSIIIYHLKRRILSRFIYVKLNFLIFYEKLKGALNPNFLNLTFGSRNVLIHFLTCFS